MSNISPQGYVMCSRVLEHRIIMEKAIGRPLRRGEEVHHIDHNRTNNELSNLQLVTTSEHRRIHRGWKKINGTLVRRPVCITCKRELPPDAFSPRRWECKKCRCAKVKARYTQRKKEGLCVACGEPAMGCHVHCAAHGIISHERYLKRSARSATFRFPDSKALLEKQKFQEAA